ncbi:hypothetical protein CDAR_22731 [Caerostris darwini]|uniref:Ycf15 n=1 Tax=Caerostris darwini TaxID=1538125 RepID=A0AAV4S575_9ARAC|nr:hypothetical protein CDAR_22731 [Caerostris darwini]
MNVKREEEKKSILSVYYFILHHSFGKGQKKIRLLFTHSCLLAQDILFPSQNEGWWRRKRLSVGDVMFGEPYLKNLTWGGSLGSIGSNRSMPKAKSQGGGVESDKSTP